jgi:ubiquitin thioesterase CYLD
MCRAATSSPEEEPSPPQFVALSSVPAEVGVEIMVQLRTPEGENLFGVVRFEGEVPGAAGRWAGVEMENEVKGGHSGTVGGKRLFSCPPGKGAVVPLTHLVPDPRFAESLPLQQDFGGIECPAVEGHYPPHPTVKPEAMKAEFQGRNRGIQGHQNSCYLDATLFSMFCFTSAFDSLLYRPRGPQDIKAYNDVQRVLRDEIVNPLRRQLYVRADRVMKLRHLLDSLSDVTGLTDQEKDPEEFLSSLLTQVMKAEPFLELSSGQTAHHYQLFVERDPDTPLPSVQDLFDQSFNSSRVKLRRAPPVLILQMPRFGRQYKVYDRILPSQLLDVTDIIEASPRQCVICGLLAEWECAQCFGDHDSGLQSTAFCQACLQRTHQHARRTSHKPTQLKTPPGYPAAGGRRPDKTTPIPRLGPTLTSLFSR